MIWGPRVSVELGSAHSLGKAAEGQEEALSRMQSVASDAMPPHSIEGEDRSPLGDRKEATPTSAVGTQRALSHRSSAAESRLPYANWPWRCGDSPRFPTFGAKVEDEGVTHSDLFKKRPGCILKSMAAAAATTAQ